MATLLFIVHPNFAVDAWQTENKKADLTSYYNSVLDAIGSHKGHVAVTLMPPYTILNGTADDENRQIHDNFLQSLAQTKATLYHEDQRATEKLGAAAHPLIDNLLLEGAVDKITFAGGYFQSCLRETWQHFKAAYHQYCLENAIKVDVRPELVLCAGTKPATLSNTDPTATYISWS